jgi:hypothetical protein
MPDALAEPCYPFATRTLARDPKAPIPQIEKDSVPPRIQGRGRASNTALRIGRTPDIQSTVFAPKTRERPESKHYSADPSDRKFLWHLPQLLQNLSMLLREAL